MSLSENGFVLIDDFVEPKYLNAIKKELCNLNFGIQATGIRNAEKKLNSVSHLVRSDLLLGKATDYLAAKVNLVRSIIFNKSFVNNWFVPWHQDKTIAVSQRKDLTGWGPWSIKDKVHHVQPPINVLEQMLTFRIHLDHTIDENGCLKIIPKSHEQGLMSQQQIQEHVRLNKPVACEAKAGSMLVMRPHILHASNKARISTERRILHIEYSDYIHDTWKCSVQSMFVFIQGKARRCRMATPLQRGATPPWMKTVVLWILYFQVSWIYKLPKGITWA